MFQWFRNNAPIRSKLMTSTIFNTSMVGLGTAAGWNTIGAPLTQGALAACAGIVMFTFVVNLGMRKLIADPYVTTVVRMEALAAGDVTSDIQFTNFKDCVGRMTKAMHSFKSAAIERQRLEEEAAALQTAQETQRTRQFAIDNAKAEDLKAFVGDVETSFDALSEGDLTVRMTRPVAAGFEPIRTKFNDSIASLEDAIGSVVRAVGTIRVGLSEISVASGDLSQRTEQQAANIEQTVAALSDVTRGVNGTASEAVHAQASATSALASARKGGEIVARAVEAMGQIELSSSKIGSIIGVIDEIAFQTNLLALNAGVEAARAGEAGRGFAVVAQEVRGLAQRSAEAAKEIKSLISLSSIQVGQGVDLVTASGESLNEIVSEVSDMAGMVATIASAAKEQSVTLKEVSTAADHMDKVTQQNAAMVEQTTAAAQTLSSETNELSRLMERFRTGNPVMSAAQSSRAALVRSTRPVGAVVQMRTSANSGAQPKLVSDVELADWEEF